LHQKAQQRAALLGLRQAVFAKCVQSSGGFGSAQALRACLQLGKQVFGALGVPEGSGIERSWHGGPRGLLCAGLYRCLANLLGNTCSIQCRCCQVALWLPRPRWLSTPSATAIVCCTFIC